MSGKPGQHRPMKPDGIRARVLGVLTLEPVPGNVIAEALPDLTRQQIADALFALYLNERVEREGRKSGARWRLQSFEEAEAAERRRERGRVGAW